jgi:hypothetical protein
MKCLSCGTNKGKYCEQCYQDLIAEIMNLQFRIYELEKQLNKKPKHLKDDIEKHIPVID